MISKLELDAPNDKGVSKRQQLMQVYKQTGTMPVELDEEVKPDFWDEPIFNMFFEIFQRDKEFYQTLYYYQKIYDLKLDGEDISILRTLWDHANKYLHDKDRKKQAKNNNASKPKPHPKKPVRHR